MMDPYFIHYNISIYNFQFDVFKYGLMASIEAVESRKKWE